MPPGLILVLLLFLAADLREAVRAGDAAATVAALDSGGDPNTRDALGATALHDAVWNGRGDLARILLDHHADPNIRHAETGDTPLHYCAIKGDAVLTELLLFRGADVRATDAAGSTALHLAAARGYRPVVKLLIAHKAPIDARDRSGATPLNTAAAKGYRETVAELLASGAKADDADMDNGTTPLNNAAIHGHADVVELLLDAGAKPDLQDRSGATPLENAARFLQANVVRVLLAHSPPGVLEERLLEEAILKGQTDIVKMLLARNANVNVRWKSGSTPLHDAALKGRQEIAALLLEHGAEVNLRNNYGATPLHDAALAGQTGIAALLLAHGADVNARETESGSTPLYNAASLGRELAVELLLEKGADAKLANLKGTTPLRAALDNGFVPVAEILKSAANRLPYNQTILGDHPVAFWSLNPRAATEPDLSGNGHTGTYVGGSPTRAMLPNGDPAAGFDGVSQYLTVPSHPALSIATTGVLTWELWFQPAVVQFTKSSDGYVDVMGKCAVYGPSCEWEARLYNAGNPQDRCSRLSAYVFNPAAGLGSSADWQPGCGLLQPGQWLHVVGEYAMRSQPSDCPDADKYPGSIDIWVNGVKWNQPVHSPTGCMSQYQVAPQAGNSPLNIGTMARDTWFQGAVAKVAIYNYALTEAQIEKHYQAMTGRKPNGSCGQTCDLSP